MVSYSRPRSLPCASPLPLPMEMAIIDGQVVLGDEVVERGEEHAVGAIGADDERGGGAGHVLLGDIDGDLARVRRGMAGGDDELCGVVGVGCAEGALVAGDAGVEFAVGGVHGEFDDGAVGEIGSRSFRARRVCVGPMMKLPSASGEGTAPSGSSLAET